MDVMRHVLIRGRVQGVGFRAWTEYTALERGLQGWVRNRRDGAVEAVFVGPADAVAAMIAACHQVRAARASTASISATARRKS